MKIKQSLIFAFCMPFVIAGCNNQSEIQNPISNNDSVTTSVKIDTMALITLKCFPCHNPDLEAETRLAPPMFKVREHYLSDSISKQDFTNAIWKFVQNPSEELSIMPGAVNNFNLMPKQDFSETDVKNIAAYIYDNDISSDSWYKSWASINKK